MDYLIKNHLPLLIIAYLVIAPLFIGGGAVVPANPLGAIVIKENGKDVVNFTNPVHFVDRVTNQASTTIETLKIGQTGTQMTGDNVGTCYIKAYATTIGATTTAHVDCQGTAAIGSITAAGSALAGVTLADSCQIALSTTTSAAGGTVGTSWGGLTMIGARASTTAGYIQLQLLNLTGTTFTWPLTGQATGTAFYRCGS